MQREMPGAHRTSGFTLIELLIVVAIIAILAGIAMPNFLEAQTRSKVARVKSDLRTISGALEAFKVDNQKYPPSTLVLRYERLIPLTTPIPYISKIPTDIFNGTEGAGAETRKGNYVYIAMPIDTESRYLILGDGPDRKPDYAPAAEFYPGYSDQLFEAGNKYGFIRYDPTNGTVSKGDIFWFSDHANQ